MEPYQPTPRFFNVNKTPKIGESCSLVDTLLDCNDQIIIGDYVSFGHGCKVLTGLHDYTLKGEARQVSNKTEPVIISDGVWIASGVIICPGVTIGENSVIGAGSVVTHSIPANVLAAGVPAKIIKTI
jgi:maltose O-acetyltransferase